MKHYLKILSFVKPHWRDIVISVIFNILLVIFSLASITILIPVLKIIFESTDVEPKVVAYNGIMSLKPYLESSLNSWIFHQIQDHGAKGVLYRVLSFAAILVLLKNICRYIGAIYLDFVKNKVERDIRASLYQKVLSFDIAYLNDQKKGDLLTRMSSDIQEIQWTVLSSIQRIAQDPLMIILTLTLLFIFSVKLTVFVLVALPFAAFVISRIGKSLKAPSKRAKEELANLLSNIEETFSGFQIIKSFVVEHKLYKKFEKNNEAFMHHMNDTLKKREWSSPISEILGFLVIAGIILYGGVLILDQNELDPSIFITYIALFYQIIAPSKTLSNAFYDIKRGEASAIRILDVLKVAPTIVNDADAKKLAGFKENIVFDQVSFKYDQVPVLTNLSFSLKKGNSLALVGESGSGKSTIAALLSRFYDVDQGAIKIDGFDIRTYEIAELRKHIAYIAQDSFLFHDSIKNNLSISRDNVTMEEIIEAAKVANAHDFIVNLDEGYDTVVGDRGIKLSGGQRQRIAITRAVLKEAPILVLDEATSSLDAESEKLVQEAFERIMKDKTSIIIAHRLSTIKNADQILVLKDGEIVEIGKHKELLNQGGVYSKFVELQRF